MWSLQHFHTNFTTNPKCQTTTDGLKSDINCGPSLKSVITCHL